MTACFIAREESSRPLAARFQCVYSSKDNGVSIRICKQNAMSQHNFRQLQAVCDGHRGVQAGTCTAAERGAWSMVVIFTSILAALSCLSWYLFSTALYMNNAIAPSLPLMLLLASTVCTRSNVSPVHQARLFSVCPNVIPIQCCCVDQASSCSCRKAMPKAGVNAFHREMIRAKPSTHWPVDPEMPARLYPRGGIKVCLEILVKVPTGVSS